MPSARSVVDGATRPRSALRWVVVDVVGCLFLAACGGGSTDVGGSDATSSASAGATAAADSTSAAAGTDTRTAAAEAPDPCALLTAADLDAVYGLDFGEGSDATEDAPAEQGYRACQWEGSNGYSSFVLQTFAGSPDGSRTVDDVYAESVASDSGPTRPGSAGDQSVVFTDEGGFLAVAGGVYLDGRRIGVTGADPAPTAGGGDTLLATAVAKLP